MWDRWILEALLKVSEHGKCRTSLERSNGFHDFLISNCPFHAKTPANAYSQFFVWRSIYLALLPVSEPRFSSSPGLSSANPKMAAQEWNSDREYHESLVSNSTRATDRQCNLDQEEIRTTPLFSADVLASVNGTQSKVSPTPDILPQYSFLGKVLNIFGGHDQQNTDEIQTTDSEELGVTMNPNGQSKTKTGDSRLFVNMNSPWSAFICGSQGSGKSHTLSCMLEGALIPSRLGKLPCPLAAMVFHYDKFTGFKTSQICEAAYLCSTGTPVTVLVSSSNFHRMRRAYASMPGWPLHAPKPVVAPLLLDENHLNIEHILKLMAIDEKEGKISLYMEVSGR